MQIVDEKDGFCGIITNILLYVGYAHEHRNNMKKINLKLLLIVVLAVLMLALVACNEPAPIDPPTNDTPSDDTPAPVTFTVTFDSKGGTGIEGYKDVEFGQQVAAPVTNPTKEGYEFDCWTLSNGDKVDFNTYTVYSNVTFYASWKAKSYDLTAYLTDEKVSGNILDLSSGSVADYYGANVTVNDGEKYNLRNTVVDGVTVKTLTFALSYESTTSSGQSLPVPTTTRDGDRFMYWYYYEGDEIVQLSKTLAKGSTATTIELLRGYKYDGARTLYAMWYSALENVTVKFNSGLENETIDTPDMVVKVGDYISAPDTPSISGYDFDKWTYVIKDDEDEEKVVDMSFYVDASSQGVAVTLDLTTDGVFNLYGSWTKRIEINSASDFASLDDTDEMVQNANIYLMADVNLGEWSAKFDENNSFKGVFDGNGHTITFTISNGDSPYLSLIGVNDGTIKELLVSAVINVTELGDGIEKYYASGVAGVSTGTISAVDVRYFNATVKADTTIHVGSVVGYNNDSEISGSKATNVIIDVDGTEVYAGGVVGLNNRGFVKGFTLYGTGKSADITASGDGVYAGAFAGRINAGEYTECSATSVNIEATASNSVYAGGVAGRIVNNTLEKISLSAITISAKGNNAYAGGAVGDGGSTLRHILIDGATVVAEGTKVAVAGGMVGSNYCESGNRGQIQFSIVKASSVTAKGDGKAYAGGIAGQQNAGASSSNGAVTRVYAECDVAVVSAGTAKLGSAFGVYDTKTVCSNVYVSSTAVLTLNGTAYDKEAPAFEVTTRTDVMDVTPGFETIQNASWVNGNLKLNSSASSSNPIWIVADGAYPTLAFTA